MRKIIAILMFCMELAFLLMGCSKQIAYKEYRYIGENKENGYMIEVDGIPYRQLPEIPWYNLPDGETINLGTVASIIGAPGDKTNLYRSVKDANRIFITMYDGNSTHMKLSFYRSDLELPVFGRANVDEICYEKGGQWFGNRKMQNFIRDQKIIDDLFNLTDPAKGQSPEADSKYFGYIYCMNDSFPGICNSIPVYAQQNKYLINMGDDNTWFEIPQYLLEQIADEKLPTASEYIASQ